MINEINEKINEAASLAVYSSRRSAEVFTMFQEVVKQKDKTIEELRARINELENKEVQPAESEEKPADANT